MTLLWPSCSHTNKTDAATLLQELELTRRFLIAIKKYLAAHNHDKQDGTLLFRLEDESSFKDVYYGLLAKARIHEHEIVRSGRLTRSIKTQRIYYDSSARALIPELEQRWAKLWDAQNPELQRLHQHNSYSGDTVDYLAREDELVLLFYPGDVRERWAFGHKRSKPTSAELEELLARTGVKISGCKSLSKKSEFKAKHKKERCEALLAEVLKIAGPDGALAPAKQSRAHHALLNRHLSELIRDARIHVSELLATYERKYTVTEYVGKVKSLDKELPDVARRVAEWNERYESLFEQISPLWELADAREEQSDKVYKAALLPALRALITDFAGGSVWDFAYASVTGQSDKDGSTYRSALASWREAYNDDLVETFGEDEALRLPQDLPVMDLMCMWLFCAHIPGPGESGGEPMPVSVFYWLWKQGHFDGEVSDDWLLPYAIDWDSFVAALPRAECEQVHDLAIRVWEIEMLEIHECLEWAKGNVEDRRTAKWIEHGNEIAQYVAEANGIIAFVDTYEACYDKMEQFISWVLFPSHELGHSKHYEHLAVGAGVISFQVSISIEASLFSRISADATLSYQYSGKLAQDDDRRVRWTGSHSFNFSVSADAKLTLADMVETQTALDLLKASVSAGKELYSAATVSVYESPKHLAAVWAEQLAQARYWVTTPVNGIHTPGGFQRFRGVPGSQTQEEILEKVVGGKSKLQEITTLLQRPRVRAKRRGLSDTSSDWTVAAEIAVPLMQGKAERLAEAKRVMHFSRRKMDKHDPPKERYAPNLVTYTWAKNLYAFPFSPAKLDSAELGFSWTEVIEDPGVNPLDLYPEASSDPPTTELLGGFLKRLDPDSQEAEWKAWTTAHREELHALFNKLADPSSNARTELLADAPKPGKKPANKLETEAQALLDLVDVEVERHIAPVKPQAWAAPRGGKIALGSTTGSPTVLAGVDFGVTALGLVCHTGWHHSTRFFRRGPKTYILGERRRGKLISPDTHPIFIVRPGNSYELEFELEHPKRIKSLELDIFDAKGASVLAAPWLIDAAQLDVLFDPKQPTLREKSARHRGKLRWYGSKDGALAKGTIARLEDRALQGGAPLDSGKGAYCLVLSVKEATAGPPDAALAWTYFSVLDDPLAKLEAYLQAAGDNQDAERKPRWTHEESEESSSEEDPAPGTPGRSEATPEAPKVEPPKIETPKLERIPLVEEEQRRRVAKLVIGIQNLGQVRGYTCYLNSALQLILHCHLLPSSRSTAALADPTLAQELYDFAAAYEAKRETGVDYWPNTELGAIERLRARLHSTGVVAQLRNEDDAAATLFGLLDACSTTAPGRSPSKLHFELRVTKSYAPGEGRAFASSKEGAKIKRKYGELSEANTTVELQRHNRVLIDGLPDTATALPLQTLWDASWDADVSDDEASRKFKGERYYPAAQPTRQVIAFEGELPNPLLIGIKRFVSNGRGGTAKLATPVEVEQRPMIRGQQHRLIGFIEHIGDSLRTGHYVVYLRRRRAWYRCSDQAVVAIDDEHRERRWPCDPHHVLLWCVGDRNRARFDRKKHQEKEFEVSHVVLDLGGGAPIRPIA